MIFPELLMIVTVSVNGILTYGTALDAPMLPTQFKAPPGVGGGVHGLRWAAKNFGGFRYVH